jgi:hypothetical protein
MIKNTSPKALGGAMAVALSAVVFNGWRTRWRKWPLWWPKGALDDLHETPMASAHYIFPSNKD